jgi:hypothetical protein
MTRFNGLEIARGSITRSEQESPMRPKPPKCPLT